MEYQVTVKGVLHHLGIGKSYSGYHYILYGMELIEKDEEALMNITKFLYIDIAKEFKTSHTCVERNIRKVIEVIWEHSDKNRKLILKIFGKQHLLQKPSNKAFLELLYEYIKANSLFEDLLNNSDMMCPITKQLCAAYREIIEKLVNID